MFVHSFWGGQAWQGYRTVFPDGGALLLEEPVVAEDVEVLDDGHEYEADAGDDVGLHEVDALVDGGVGEGGVDDVGQGQEGGDE